jgi:hypothetical protein
LVLEALPDNEEAKALLRDFKKREPEQIERLRLQRAERTKKVFVSFTSGMIGNLWFESHELKTSKPPGETRSAIVTQLTSGPPIFKIVRSETEMAGEIFKIEATQDFSGGARRCLIVGGPSQDDQTQIFFKVLELRKAAFYEQPLTALVGGGEAKYLMINPNQPQLSDKLKVQISEGVSNLTARIQSAIGQTTAVQSATPQGSGLH